MSVYEEQEILGYIRREFLHLRKTKTLCVETIDGKVVTVTPSRADMKYFRGNVIGQKVHAYGYWDDYDKTYRANRMLIGTSTHEQAPLFPDTPLIYVDSNEMAGKESDPQVIAGLLRDRGWDVRQASLDVGDWLLSDRVLVERKTIDDFHGSISDGRFFDQMEDLAGVCEFPNLAVYGDVYSSRTRPEVFWGSWAWALTNDDTPINLRMLLLPDLQSLIQLFERIVMREQIEQKHYPALKKIWKAQDEQEEKLRVVASYPGIGVKTAKKLLKDRGTVEGVVTAPRLDLAQIIGHKKAYRMEAISKNPYQEEVS